jgi:nucleoside-diphosphate-sugar epimerase
MIHDVKNVFIAGGTGFLGYYSALLFLKRGCRVASIALPGEINLDHWYPKEIDLCFGNLFEMSEDEIYNLLKGRGFDTFVYSLGPDDRMIPKAPSYDFFHLRLVEHCLKICRAAKRAGIKRCLVMNSYFTYFDRLQHGKLANDHPYIRCRVEQATAISDLGEEGVFDVMIMELPFIFGSMPGRIPIWKSVFMDRFEKMPFVFFPDGGTAAIHVTGVAESVFAAACNGVNGERYPVSSANIKYRTMINYMMACAGFNKKFVKMPNWMCYLAGVWLLANEKITGLQGGLNPTKLLTNVLSKDLFMDPSEIQKKLGYEELGFHGGESIWKGIQEVIIKCYPEKSIERLSS